MNVSFYDYQFKERFLYQMHEKIGRDKSMNFSYAILIKLNFKFKLLAALNILLFDIIKAIKL